MLDVLHKIDWGPGYRIYLAMDGKDLIILYGGGTKASQRSDIEVAKALHAEYKAANRLNIDFEVRAISTS